jgi:hypothetical protein
LFLCSKLKRNLAFSIHDTFFWVKLTFCWTSHAFKICGLTTTNIYIVPPHNGLSYYDKTNVCDALELHFEIEPKNHNNMELEDLIFHFMCINICYTFDTWIFCIAKHWIVELGGHWSICHKPSSHIIPNTSNPPWETISNILHEL